MQDYGDETLINDLFLTVINDGNGSVCGMSYEGRLNAAKNLPHDRRMDVWAKCCLKYLSKDGRDSVATLGDIISASAEIDAYYQEHIVEGA